MHLIDNFLKIAIIKSRLADQRTVFLRWLTIAVFLVIFWSVSTLILSPILFSHYNNINLEPLNYLGLILRLISMFFTPPALFLLFTSFAGCILAVKFVTIYFASVHGKINLISSRNALWKRIFGIPTNELTRVEDSALAEKNLQPLRRIGGPAKIVVPAEYAALLEEHNHQVQIVGPTMNLPDNCYLMKSYEILKNIINLQNQSVQLDISTQTKDRRLLLINNIQAIFSVYRNRQSSSLTRPYPFNAHSIFTLYYDIAPGSLQEKFVDILKCGLIQYMRQFNYSEFFREENQLAAAIGGIQKQITSPLIFKKRQKYSTIIRKPVFSFFQNRIPKNRRSLKREYKKIRLLYLDLIKFAEIQTSNMEGERNKEVANLIVNFQTYINPILEKKGFQLHLLNFGTIVSKKRNEKVNIIIRDENEVRPSNKYLQDQINELIADLDHSNYIFSDREFKKRNLKKIRALLECSSNSETEKLITNKRQVEQAIENINQLIKSQE